MFPNSKKYLAFFALSLFTVPICAAHTDSASWEPTQPTMIGEAQVEPGKYELKVNEDEHQLQIIKDGKVMTTVLCYWEGLPKRADDTKIEVNKDEVTEVQFKGRPEAIVFFIQ